ncbi:MAG: phenylalanine--tRNA ligase subunit beta [Rhodospirillaceae bacterium]
MKFTLSWLKDHLETTASLADITAKLTAIGLEVEGVEDPGKGLEQFIVAHVVEAKPHPNADRLRLCTVNTGTETLQVVCGAPNARTGMKAVLARPGVVIPISGEVLKKGKIRDVESQGMLCSYRELKLGEDHAGIIDLPEEAPTGAPVTEILKIDPVIEINLTPNRVDALGVYGIARDLAAAGLGTLKPLNTAAVPGKAATSRKIKMGLPPGQEHKCPHFVGRTIRGVTNGESPAWLKDRLQAIGLRPVSVLVDITQYLTIDLGRPLHAFDDAKLTGDVGPRPAKPGEQIAALNGKTYTLDESMVVIADEAAGLGIGGIMGGEPSSVTEKTTAVFLESALFDPKNIAETGRKLLINSDARYAFERGVDPESCRLGIEVATRMVVELCGGEPADVVEGGKPPEWKRTIAFKPALVKKLAGVEIPETEMRSILTRLGFTVDAGWNVAPPSWRSDVESWQDIVEEILRIHGYDNIPATPMPRLPMPKQVWTTDQKRWESARRVLAARGLNETVTWAFMARTHAETFLGNQPLVLLANPISSDLDAMRPSLIPNLAMAAGRNAARGLGDAGLFELGPRFEGPKPGQQALVACALRAGHTSARHWDGSRRQVDALDAKADAIAALEAAGAGISGLQTGAGAGSGVPPWFHPGRAGVLKLGNQILAAFGELHPAILSALDVKGPVVACEVFLERIPAPKKSKTGSARPLLRASNFQPVERDFAFVVDASVGAETLLRAVRGAERELISDIGLFDVYEGPHVGEGKKSLAIAVTLQPKDATLTDEQIDGISKKIVAAAEKACGAKLRA